MCREMAMTYWLENWAQRAPIRSKRGRSAGGLSDRSGWGSLGDVAASTRLITQRSLVQIQPPATTKNQGPPEHSGGPWCVQRGTGAARQNRLASHPASAAHSTRSAVERFVDQLLAVFYPRPSCEVSRG